MKDKILNFLIIFFLTILLVNIFFKDNSQNSNWTLTFNLEKKSYTIPASPVIVVSNNTQTDVKINTCKDININFSWEKLSFPNDFCKDIEIKANTKEKINYNKYYDKFWNIWVYNFIIKYDNKEYITQTEIKNKWLISKIFVWLIYAPLYNLTIFFVEFFNNSLWWAIITITLIIRLFLLYPQHKMMVSQRKLNAIQPKIKALQEKFKWNSQMLWVEMMKLYKDENINPFWSCWLLLIQMPILLVIYRIFINIKDYSNTYYLYNWLSNFNLDWIWHYFFWIDLLWVWWITWICLWIFIAVIQFLQVKLSLVKNNTNKPVMLEKKKDAKDYQSLMPDQDVLNKFMLYWLPWMVWVFTYSLLAWVWVYWWISTTFTIIQQLIVNKKTEK